MLNKAWGMLLSLVGAIAIGGIALHRHEPIKALWLVTAAVCIYLLGCRFYSAWIASKVALGRSHPRDAHEERERRKWGGVTRCG